MTTNDDDDDDDDVNNSDQTRIPPILRWTEYLL